MKLSYSPERISCPDRPVSRKTSLSNANTNFGKADTKKVPPLKIPSERIVSPGEELDDDKTPEYPLKEGHILFNPYTNPNKEIKKQTSTKTDAQFRPFYADELSAPAPCGYKTSVGSSGNGVGISDLTPSLPQNTFRTSKRTRQNRAKNSLELSGNKCSSRARRQKPKKVSLHPEPSAGGPELKSGARNDAFVEKIDHKVCCNSSTKDNSQAKGAARQLASSSLQSLIDCVMSSHQCSSNGYSGNENHDKEHSAYSSPSIRSNMEADKTISTKTSPSARLLLNIWSETNDDPSNMKQLEELHLEEMSESASCPKMSHCFSRQVSCETESLRVTEKLSSSLSTDLQAQHEAETHRPVSWLSTGGATHVPLTYHADFKFAQKRLPISSSSFSSENDSAPPMLLSSNTSAKSNERYNGTSTRNKAETEMRPKLWRILAGRGTELDVISVANSSSSHPSSHGSNNHARNFDSGGFKDASPLLLQQTATRSTSLSKERRNGSEKSCDDKTKSDHRENFIMNFSVSKEVSRGTRTSENVGAISEAFRLSPAAPQISDRKHLVISSSQIHPPVQTVTGNSASSFQFPVNRICNALPQIPLRHLAVKNFSTMVPRFDPLWANKPTRPCLVSQVDARNEVLPVRTSCVQLESRVVNTESRRNDSKQLTLSPEHQVLYHENHCVPKNYSPRKFSQLSAENFNMFRHFQTTPMAQGNKTTQRTVDSGEKIKYPSWVLVPSVKSSSNNKTSVEVSNSHASGQQMTAMSQSQHLPRGQSSQHQRAGDYINNELPGRDICASTAQVQSTLAHSAQMKDSVSCCERPVAGNILGDGVEAKTGIASVNMNLPYEPMDLSRRPVREMNTSCAETSQKRSVHAAASNRCQHQNLSETYVENRSKSADLHCQIPLISRSYQPATGNSNKETDVLNTELYTLPRAFSANLQSCYTPSVNSRQRPPMETVFQHNIAQDDKNLHRLNKANLKSTVTQIIPPYRTSEHNPSHLYTMCTFDQNVQKQLPHSVGTSSTQAEDHLAVVSDVSVTCLSSFPTLAVTMSGGTSPCTSDSSSDAVAKLTNSSDTGFLWSSGSSDTSVPEQRRSSTNSDNTAMSCTPGRSSSDFTTSAGNVSSKVVPLPVKDFFTRSPQENTYSSLLMAKITSQNKNRLKNQGDTEVFPFAQMHKDRYAFEIDNSLQKNLIIDLTEGDEDCDVVSISSKDSLDEDSRLDFVDVTLRDGVSTPASGTASVVNEIIMAGSGSSTNIPSAGFSSETGHPHGRNDHDSDSGRCVCTEQSDVLPVNIADLETTSVSANSGRDQTQQDHNLKVGETELRYISDCEETADKSNVLPAQQPCGHSVLAPTFSPLLDSEKIVTSDENVATESSVASPKLLKIVASGKDIVAKKLLTVVQSRKQSEGHPPGQFLSSLPSKHTPETQQFHTVNTQEADQALATTNISTHDNSTQRAAATLLELSKNPLYNSYRIDPETSDAYQEKVYQIHPTLDDTNLARELEAQEHTSGRNGHGSRRPVDMSETATCKSGTRTSRRVGRPPKDLTYPLDNTSGASHSSTSGADTFVNPSVNTVSVTTSEIPSPRQMNNAFHVCGHPTSVFSGPLVKVHPVDTISAISAVNNACISHGVSASIPHASSVRAQISEPQHKVANKNGVSTEKTLQANSAIIEMQNDNPNASLKAAVINTRIPSSNLISSAENISLFAESFRSQKANVRTLFDDHRASTASNISVSECSRNMENLTSASIGSVSSSFARTDISTSSAVSASPRFISSSSHNPFFGSASPGFYGQDLNIPQPASGSGQSSFPDLSTVSAVPDEQACHLVPPAPKRVTRTRSKKIGHEECSSNAQDTMFTVHVPLSKMSSDTGRLVSGVDSAAHASPRLVTSEAESNVHITLSDPDSVRYREQKRSKSQRKRKKTTKGRRRNNKKQKSFQQNVSEFLQEVYSDEAVSNVVIKTAFENDLQVLSLRSEQTQKGDYNGHRTLNLQNDLNSCDGQDVEVNQRKAAASIRSAKNVQYTIECASLPSSCDCHGLQNVPATNVTTDNDDESELEKVKAVTSLLATMMHKKFQEPVH